MTLISGSGQRWIRSVNEAQEEGWVVYQAFKERSLKSEKAWTSMCQVPLWGDPINTDSLELDEVELPSNDEVVGGLPCLT